MIRTFLIAIAVGGLMTTGCAAYYREPPNDDNAAYDDGSGYDEPQADVGMFAELSAWGQWRHLEGYGWAWQPFASAAWSPYLYGHWAWTDFGWTWISYEPFGWATYHYGYWTRDPDFGWVWIPGYDWSPCRVDWAVFGGYVGWAPLPPPGVHIGRPWGPGGSRFWVVVRAGSFTDPDIGHYRLAPTRYKALREHRDAVYRAPKVGTIERFKGTRVPTVRVQLDRRTKNGREFDRMRLPDRQARIVEQHRAEASRASGHGRGNGGGRPRKGSQRQGEHPRAHGGHGNHLR